MNYQEAMAYMESISTYGSVLGLDNIRELLNRLDNPQEKLRVVHIAGTNGKGSILAYLDAVLQKSGYRVGRYISPTIYEYRERFQINGIYISENSLAKHMKTIKQAVDSMVADGLVHPTVFELETALGFLYFLEEEVHVLLLETGLGGRMDATNVVSKPLCVILGSISMDHMQFLGNTLAEITREKAGIIKAGSPVVLYPNPPEVTEIIREVCEEKQAVLHEVKLDTLLIKQNTQEGIHFVYGKYPELFLTLLGEFQVYNAATALEALGVIWETFCLSDFSIFEGLKAAKWEGRFEIMEKDPIFIRDGAHNEDAARQLAKCIQYYFTNRRIIYIIGILADKEYEKILAITAPLARLIFTITPDNSRALPAKELAQCAKKWCDQVV